MRRLVAGNWKMNGTRAGAAALAAALRGAGPVAGCDLLACPPATVLAMVAEALDGSAVAVGGQDCHEAASGAHTGDVSAPMRRDLGASAVIIGHSERRQAYFETDALVQRKALAAERAGLMPIVCVGETERQRQDGEAGDAVRAQVLGSLPPGFAGVVAYEPIWAIGTGKVATTGMPCLSARSGSSADKTFRTSTRSSCRHP